MIRKSQNVPATSFSYSDNLCRQLDSGVPPQHDPRLQTLASLPVECEACIVLFDTFWNPPYQFSLADRTFSLDHNIILSELVSIFTYPETSGEISILYEFSQAVRTCFKLGRPGGDVTLFVIAHFFFFA